MSDFQDCIVSYIDLNNVRSKLESRRISRKGVGIMRQLHELVFKLAPSLRAHEEVCVWQDSVLLFAPIKSQAGFGQVMADVSRLKNEIEAHVNRCHAVCVKGQSFPAPKTLPQNSKPRTIYLSASSLAFSNCWIIGAKLKKYKADWYIDSRIMARISGKRARTKVPVALLPGNAVRHIHVFKGSFA
jgi:hypothetical protein